MQSSVRTTTTIVVELIMPDKQFIGVDVSKGWIDVATAGRPGHRRIDNCDAAIQHWLGTLDTASVDLVAFEPTGGYERPLKRALRRAGLAFARVHPNEIVAFRRRRGVKAKTDPIDARLLADFAAIELASRGLAPLVEDNETLRELSARRRQLVATLQGERCRAAMASSAAAKASFTVVAEALESALAAIETALEQTIRTTPEFAAMAALLRSLKEVGPVTVHTLLAELPELGSRSGKQIAALVGLAPQQRDSGTQRGRAVTGHGRPGVRRVLFNAARIAIRYNQTMRAFYQRLVQTNRRPGKVALTAVMRKMLVTLNAIARDRQPWQPTETVTA